MNIGGVPMRIYQTAKSARQVECVALDIIGVCELSMPSPSLLLSVALGLQLLPYPKSLVECID